MTVWNRTASGGWSASSTGQSASSLGYGGSSSSKSSSSSSSSSSSTKTYTYTQSDGTVGTTTDYRHSDAAKAADAANRESTSTTSSGSSSSGSSSSGSSSSGSSKTPVVTTAEVYIPSGGVDLSGVKVNSDGSISGATISSGSSRSGTVPSGAIPSAASLNSNIPTQTVTGNITPANFAEQGITVQVDRPDALAARDAAVAALAAQGIDYYSDLTAGQQSALITNIMHGKQDTTYIDNDSRSGTYQYATPGTPVTEETYNTLLGIQSTEPQNSPAVFAEAVQNYVDAGYTPTNIPTNPQPSNIPVETPTTIGGNPQPTEIVINIPEQEDNTGDGGIGDLLKSMLLMNLLGGSSGGGSGTSGDTAYYPVETAGSSSGFDFGQFFDRYKVPIFGIIALAVVILIISKAPAAKKTAAKRSTKA